jgi:hypothetical protein
MKRTLLLLLCATMLASALCASAWAGEAKQRSDPSLIRGWELTRIRKASEWISGLITTACVALGSVGMMLAVTARSPWRVAMAEQAVRRGRWRMLLLGILSEVVLFLLAIIYFALAKEVWLLRFLFVMVLVVGGVFLWLAAIGLAGSARLIGQSLLGEGADELSPWRVVGAGGLVIACAGLVPFFGWAFFIFMVCRGVGAATIALFVNRPRITASLDALVDAAESPDETPPDDS